MKIPSTIEAGAVESADADGQRLWRSNRQCVLAEDSGCENSLRQKHWQSETGDMKNWPEHLRSMP